jgi:hypothetical protein
MSIPATVTMSMSMDLTPMVDSMSRQGKATAGQPPLTPDELKVVHEGVAKTLAASAEANAKATMARLKDTMGKGIRLIDIRQEQQGLKLTSHTRLAVDDLSLLPSVQFAAEQQGAPALKPFAGFKVTNKGGTVHVEGRSPELPSAPGADGELALVLETKAATTSHNADHAETGRLEWHAPLSSRFNVKASFKA